MSLSEHIIDVSENSFESDVLLKSHEVPVIVDFWAPWCAPCRSLGPILERQAIEAGGGFLLAKVNVDESPSLSIRYGVQGIPAVKAFKNGELAGEFVGTQPESMVRRFVQELVPSEADEIVSKGMSLLAIRHWAEAETAFGEVLGQDDANAPAALGLVKSLLMQGKGQEASHLLKHFPAGTEWATAEKLKPLSRALSEVEENGPYPVDDPLAAEFYQASRLIGRGNIPAAMDGLLDLLRQDKNYRKGEPKAVLLGLFELLGDDDSMTREYRDELASILF